MTHAQKIERINKNVNKIIELSIPYDKLAMQIKKLAEENKKLSDSLIKVKPK